MDHSIDHRTRQWGRAHDLSRQTWNNKVNEWEKWRNLHIYNWQMINIANISFRNALFNFASRLGDDRWSFNCHLHHAARREWATRRTSKRPRGKLSIKIAPPRTEPFPSAVGRHSYSPVSYHWNWSSKQRIQMEKRQFQTINETLHHCQRAEIHRNSPPDRARCVDLADAAESLSVDLAVFRYFDRRGESPYHGRSPLCRRDRADALVSSRAKCLKIENVSKLQSDFPSIFLHSLKHGQQ